MSALFNLANCAQAQLLQGLVIQFATSRMGGLDQTPTTMSTYL
jgi:hypothetical protein